MAKDEVSLMIDEEFEVLERDFLGPWTSLSTSYSARLLSYWFSVATGVTKPLEIRKLLEKCNQEKWGDDRPEHACSGSSTSSPRKSPTVAGL
jgi:hypothetical protein